MLSLFVHAKRATPLLRRFALPQTRSFAAAEGASGVLNARIFVLLLVFRYCLGCATTCRRFTMNFVSLAQSSISFSSTEQDKARITTFLSQITSEKVPDLAAKFSSWEQLHTLNTRELRALGTIHRALCSDRYQCSFCNHTNNIYIYTQVLCFLHKFCLVSFFRLLYHFPCFQV
jgi:hypothetical protein